MLVDDFMPVYDVSDAVATVAAADAATSGVMRTATTDDDARRWFRRYWTFGVGSGAHVLVNGLLDLTREIAEQRAIGARAASPP
jgi:hypothetical protein